MGSKKIYLTIFLFVTVFAAAIISPVANAALPNKGTWAAYHLINYNEKTFQYYDKDSATGAAIFYPTDEIKSDQRPECTDQAGTKIYPATMELIVPNNGEPGTKAKARTFERNQASICTITEEKQITLDKSDRRNQLFILNTDTNEITTWNSRGANIFKKIPRDQFPAGSASKPGYEVYRQGDTGTCQDTIVFTGSNWFLYPMQDIPKVSSASERSLSDKYAWETLASSDPYEALFVDSPKRESAYYRECSVGGHKIVLNSGIGDATGYNLGAKDENILADGQFRHKDTCGDDKNTFSRGSIHRIDRSEFDDEIEGWDGHDSDKDSDTDKNKMAHGSLIDALIYVKNCSSKDGAAIVDFVRLSPYTVDENPENNVVVPFQVADAFFKKSWILASIPGFAAQNGNYHITNGVARLTQAEIDATDAAVDLNDHPDDTSGGGDADEKTSCAVDGIGWIICPVMNFMAKMNDKAFGFLQNLLTVKPALITDQGTISAWGTFRDIANVAFVLAFLVIVYSQLTSVGISNYGIKKLLPKIIVAAILVNVSYFICALLVDLSNIVGSSIYGLLANVVPPSGGASGGGSNTWEGIVAVILTAAVGLLLFFVIFTSPFVLLALGLVLLILIARQAFVILLIVVSPLAFVAYLLPNTEDWFKKWWKALSATLMVYPIVGAIFGASTLASNILMNVANGSSGDDETLLKIVALTVLAVPLFAVPGVLKSSLAAAGSIGAKIQGLADRAQGRATRDVGKRTSEIAKNLGNRASTSMLNNNGKFAKSASFLTGVRRRTKRQDAYKQRQALRDAAGENFLNQGVAAATNAAGQVDTSQLSKAARLRVQAGTAGKTAQATNQLINNAGVQGSLVANGQLHQKVAASNFGIHHQEETLKNKGESSYLNDPSNQEHYNDLIKSREDRQGAETRANNQAKQDGEVRRAIRENKVAKGDEKIIDNEIELEHQVSDEGRSQGQRTRDVEGQLDIERTSQDATFLESTEGKQQAVAKDVQVQRKATQEALNTETAILANEDIRVEAAAAKAKLTRREADEKTLIDQLKTDEGAAANPQYAAAAAALQEADQGTRLATGAAKVAASQAEQAFVESTEGRKSSLEAQRADDKLAKAKATEEAIESELRAGGRDANGNLIQVDGLAPEEVEQFATDLSAADTAKRVQTQRSNAAKRVGDVAYAEAVKDDTTGLATTAGGIEGRAGVSQAKAVAQQTIIESFKKGVAAESTLLSSTNEDTILSDEMLGNADILDQPDEKIAAMGSVIAKRQHMTSHIKLWKRMAELRSQADAEVSAAEASGDPEAITTAKARKDKVVNLQQQVMGDKSKKPFGIGDADQGAATVGEYSNDIYKGTRDRILTHLSESSLSSMDPDDMRLIYEMARDGKLSPDHIKKIQETYKAWEGNPQLKHLLKDKTKALLDPIAKNDYSADTETDPAKRHQFDLSGL